MEPRYGRTVDDVLNIPKGRKKANRDQMLAKDIIDLFALEIRKKLNSYIEGYIQPSEAGDESEEKVSGHDTIPRGLLNSFDKIINQSKEEINSEHARNNCDILLDYFKATKKLFSRDLKMLKRLSFFNKSFNQIRMTSFLEETIKQCKKFEIYYSQPSDINIYRVVVPKESYQQLFEPSEIFFYEGRDTAVLKTSVGSLSSLIVWPIGLVICLPLLAISPAAEDVVERVCANTANMTREGVSNYGYSSPCLMNIPPEWIEGRVKNKKLKIIPNNKFSPRLEDTVTDQVIYVVDANNTEEILKNGIWYENLNPHGKFIFFHNIETALDYARRRNNGEFFDTKKGWTKYNTWEEEQPSVSDTPMPPEDSAKAARYSCSYRRP